MDKSTVIDSGVIDSPVLGKIPPIGLSGGVKTLILVKFEPEKVFNASTCGDNCAKWLLKIAEREDRTVNLRHLMDFGKKPFKVKVLNTNQIVHSMEELIRAAGEFVKTKDFARAIQQTDNYYVIVTREGLPALPYSVEEVYGIRTSGKYGSLKQSYHSFY